MYTGSTWYYNTSQLMPGDIQQIALQANMTGQSTGRYNYTATVVDYRTTNTTMTITGTDDGAQPVVERLRRRLDAPGPGEDHLGLRRRDPRPGQRRARRSGSPAASAAAAEYTDPPGEFSTLVENSGGGYTRTLTDGTQITFDSSGRRDGHDRHQRSSHHATPMSRAATLITITDPYHQHHYALLTAAVTSSPSRTRPTGS